ncbi:MAG TPA: carboxypeptidase-like regulatory domain-containing protein, partial [Blastocatellia bacterium]
MKKLSSANPTLILSFLLLLFGPRVFAQLGAAGISGAVTDQQGAAVVGADVTVKNKATGQTRKTTSGEDGTYRLQNLPPAVYEIRVEARGFGAAMVDNVEARVGEVPTVNLSLRAAGASETIVISASDAVGVDTSTSQVSSSISDRTLTSLPLNGRNFLDLAFLLPGNRPATNFDP